MGEMQTHLEQMFHMVEAPGQIVRFHSLQSKSKEVPVLPWKLEVDVKNSKLHGHIQALVGCTVWQLLSLPAHVCRDPATCSEEVNHFILAVKHCKI